MRAGGSQTGWWPMTGTISELKKDKKLGAFGKVLHIRELFYDCLLKTKPHRRKSDEVFLFPAPNPFWVSSILAEKSACFFILLTTT